jgi:hypothetical protein
MKVIAARSPYIIEINETNQVGSKLELFIWHKGETEPTTPTYTLSKSISSTVNRSTVYNISQYVLENIEIIAPEDVLVPTIENNNVWCYVKIKAYKLIGTTYTLLYTTERVGIEGYTNYMDGANYQVAPNDMNYLLLQDGYKHKYNRPRPGYFNIFVIGDAGIPFNIEYVGLASIDLYLTADEIYLYKIPFVYDENPATTIKLYQDDLFYTIEVEEVCEPKYTPIVCSYINRFGGWQFLTFFKSNSTAIETKGNDYKLMPDSWDYNPLRGQKHMFNTDGMQTIKANTGWVDESYSELIQDLLLSETILVDDKPVVIKTKSTSLKSSLNDKNINYEIEFEYSYSLINNVI